MQEMIPFVGSHTDVTGPDMGTNEKVMAWFMDTYSVYQGYCVPEIVTGKPLDRRDSGPARSHWTRRGVSHRARPERAETAAGEMHGDHPGFRHAGSVTALGLALKTGMTVAGISDASAALSIAQTGSTWPRRKNTGRSTEVLRVSTAGDAISPQELLTLPCDVLGARNAVEGVITEMNAASAAMPHSGGRRRMARRRRRPTESSSSAGTRFL